VTETESVDVRRILRELALVLFVQGQRIARLGQQAIEELDVARVMLGVERIVARVAQDERATWPT